MTSTLIGSVSSLGIAYIKGAFDFAAKTPHYGAGDGHTFIPSLDAGSPVYFSGSDTAALGYVYAVSSSHTEEHMLLRDTSETGFAVYPNVAPRAASGGTDVSIDAAGTAYTSTSNFKSNVRSDLSLDSTEAATYARANILRFEVTDVGDLASSLSEVTPASKRVVRLVGVNSSSAERIGWLYIETATTVVSGTAQRFLHQFIPADMLIGPGDGVTIEDYDNSSTQYDLPGLISAKVSTGWQYSRCKTWYTSVASQTALDNAALPGTPDTPDGVTAWT